MIAERNKLRRPSLAQLDSDVASDIHALDNITKLTKLAIQLGLNLKKIDEIQNVHKDSFRQLMAMFTEWRRIPVHYTWDVLVTALRLVDEEALADKLYDKYCN